MKNKVTVIIIIASILVYTASKVSAWGIWGHNHINKGAVLALPPEMGMFFYNHSDYITEESTGPDIRKYALHDSAEFCRHYINLESYHYRGRVFMPATREEVIKKYGWDSVKKYGTLPWTIQETMDKLTDAMRHKQKTTILFLAADLGHYVGDAHMPLHTTVNHDGQLTGQQGIHAFWEIQLVELFGKNYNLYTGQAHYIKDVQKLTWDIIDSSYRLSEPLLRIEKKMKNDNPLDKQYVMGPDGKPKRNDFGSPVHTYEYAHIYHELLGGMVEKQMRHALLRTADLWYTAWVNAGKPDLSDLDPDYVTERNKAYYKEDMKAWKRGKVRGCRSTKEF